MYRIIIKFIKIYFRRKACQKIINDIDKDFFTQQKKVSSHNSKLIKDGYLKIENFLSADEVDDLIKHKDKEKNELLAITLPILKKLEKKVSNTILGYLNVTIKPLKQQHLVDHLSSLRDLICYHLERKHYLVLS